MHLVCMLIESRGENHDAMVYVSQEELTKTFYAMNIWKIINLNCGERYEDMINHRSYTPLSSCEIKAWKKKACTGFELITYAIIFFRLSFDFLSSVYSCDGQSWLHIFLRSPNIWSFIYYLHSSPSTGILLKSRKMMLLPIFYSANSVFLLFSQSPCFPPLRAVKRSCTSWITHSSIYTSLVSSEHPLSTAIYVWSRGKVENGICSWARNNKGLVTVSCIKTTLKKKWQPLET